jgi:hypothetical protein
MAITLTDNYKEVLAPEIVEIIDNLVDNGYELSDVLDTLDYFGEEYYEHFEQIFEMLEDTGADNEELYDFVEAFSVDDLKYFEDYKSAVDDYNEDAVKAYVDCCGIECVAGFEDAYEGEFDNVEAFVSYFMENTGEEIPSWIIVDYEATWNYSLRYDYYEENGFYFRNV